MDTQPSPDTISEDECQHLYSPLVMAFECQICGNIKQQQFTRESVQFASRILQVLQGFLTSEEALLDMQFTPEQKETIMAIEVCHHNTGKEVTCCGDIKRWECSSCQRKFNQGFYPAHAIEKEG